MSAILKAPTALDDILHLALREPIVRVRPILGPYGERLWLKRVEQLSWWLRLKRGDARRAFEQDLRGLHVLGDAGLPVPAILSEGPDHVVMSDVGPTLQQVLRVSAISQNRRAAAFRAAGTALGRLHAAGFAHGRPAIRTMCWEGGEAYFIDLERFSPSKAARHRQAMDVVFFAHSYIAELGKAGPDLKIALAAYRAAAPKGAWREIRSLGAWLAPLSLLAAPLRWLSPGQKGWQAFPRTLAFLQGASD